MSSEPRLLVYSQDGLGLGHLRRTTLLAADLLAACPGASALTVSDSPLGQFFSTAEGHDYLKLPSIRKTAPGSWLPITLSSPFADVLALRRDIIRSAVLGFQPDVMLVDHMPHGAMGELIPTLEAVRALPVKVVLGLRDILDAPAVIHRRWHLEGAFEAVERHYDEVLVYGSREVFDVAAEYEWPPAISRRLRYCGYVCAPTQVPATRHVRSRYLRNGQRELLVAMAGGGADAYALFSTLLSAIPELTAQRHCAVVVVTGPFLPREERLELLRRARHLPVHVVTTVPDSLGYLAAADLVVAMAGYNTTAEILSLGARALLVPRPGPSAEQTIRASRFAERGWVRWLPPDRLSPGMLTQGIVEALEEFSGISRPGPDLGGRQVAAAHLLAGLNHRPQLAVQAPLMAAMGKSPAGAAQLLGG